MTLFISFSFHVSDLNGAILDHIAYSQPTKSNVVSASKYHKGSGGFDKQFYKFNLTQKPFLGMSQTHSNATVRRLVHIRIDITGSMLLLS